MAINKREFLSVAARALGRPIPDNFFSKLDTCLASSNVVYDDLVEAKEVPKTPGQLEVRIVDCQVSTGTQYRRYIITRDFELINCGVIFQSNATHEWSRESVLRFGDDD